MKSVLRDMINTSSEEMINLDNSILQIDSQIKELQSQFDAIRHDMLDVIVGDMTSYLELKLIELEGFDIYYPPNFGVDTISNFQIIDSTGNIIYEYMGIGWDDDEKIIDYIDRFNWGYDYLYHELGVDGTYGIYPRIVQLESAKNLLLSNKGKASQVESYLSDYI